jgi:hypothetical protein
MIAPVEGSGSMPAWISFVESLMMQRYFIQFNKSLTRNEQHGKSRFTLFFAGFKITFTAFGKEGRSDVCHSDALRLPTL